MIKYATGVDICKLDKKLYNQLSTLEKAIDIDFTVSSGFRNEEENKAVGGSPTSSHLKGLAVDISCHESIQRMKIVFGALASGFKRIGIASDHVHIDIDPEKEQNVLWLE